VRVSRSEEGAEVYALAGSDVNVVVVSEDGMLAEVRTGVASPTSRLLKNPLAPRQVS
jgi:hypothetical protein